MRTGASTYQPSDDQANDLAEVVVDSLGFGVIALDQNALVTFANEPAKKQFQGISNNRHLGEFLRPTNSNNTWSIIITTALNALQVPPFDCAVINSNSSSEINVTVKCSSLRNTTNQSSGVVISVQEVRLENGGPVDQQEMLQRLASLGKLTSRVAHELNNPLDGILRYTNLALRMVDAHDDAKLTTYLQESRTGIKRMVQIISDLLEYSRTQSKDFDVSNINEIVEQAAKSISEMIDNNRVNITLVLHRENMPSVNGSRLYQVCCNLMKNALDAMPEGGELVVTTNIESNHVIIRFADSGTGLPESVQDIFQPFVTTKSIGSGTGLGLAICKDFIEGMNGTIVAQPNQPCGAVFTAKIPVGSCVMP